MARSVRPRVADEPAAPSEPAVELPPPPPEPAPAAVLPPPAAAAPLPPAPPPPDPEVGELRQQVQLLSLQLTQLTQALTGGKLGAAAFQDGGAGLMQQPGPRVYAPQPVYDPSALYPEPVYFVRIKPYDKKRRQVRLRQFFTELGRVLNGGTGQPGDIPEWAQVSGAQAAELSKYRQNDSDPMSPLVLDIVTPEEREHIDRAEAQIRASTLGLMGLNPQAALQMMNQPGQGMAPTVSSHVPQSRPAPSLMAGAQALGMQAPQVNPAAPPSPQAANRRFAPARAGRAAALAGNAAPPTPPVGDRGVSEDLTSEAAASMDAAAAIEAAERYSQQ